jgi:DNA polymerase III subunit gamma/tau
MLSKSAFNALLKTLEEPPSHVKFILATTEPEKVLPTILSRCQRYDFRNISSKEIAGHLKEICKKEKIAAEEDALALVAKAGAGSMRDALSLLDRLLSLGRQKAFGEGCGADAGVAAGAAHFRSGGFAIGAGDVKQTLERIEAMISSGFRRMHADRGPEDHLRNLLIALTCGKESGLLDIPGLERSGPGRPGRQVRCGARWRRTSRSWKSLRRNMRQNQTGRAMFDAALVRIALAEQCWHPEVGRRQAAGRSQWSKKKSLELSTLPKQSNPSHSHPPPQHPNRRR